MAGFVAVNAFAVEFKAKEGISACDVSIIVTDTEDHIAGCTFTPCNFTELSLYNEYFDITARTTNTYGFNTVKATGSVFYDFNGIKPYVASKYEFSIVGIEYKSDWNYLDAVVGTVFTLDKDWIKISGDVNFGWCFIDAVSMHKWNGDFSSGRNNVTTTTLGVSAEFCYIFTVFASMQSYQEIGFPTFKPTSVNNVIGVKAQYWFNDNWGVYGEFSHYCKHAERPAVTSHYDSYTDNSGSTAVIGVQFRY